MEDISRLDNERFSVQGAPSLEDESFVKRVRRWFHEARQARDAWFEDEQLDHRFYHGHQWSASDIKAMEESGRVPLVINRIAPVVNMVAGYERSNRNRIKFLPVDTVADPLKAELLSEVVRIVQEQSDCDYQRSAAFTDAVIGGRGYLEVVLDTTLDPRGEIRIEHIPPEEILVDPTSRRYDLSDARYIIRTQQMTMDSILEAFPEKADEILEMAQQALASLNSGKDFTALEDTHAAQNEWYEQIWQRAFDPENNTWEVWEVWYKQTERIQKYEAFNPETGQWEPIRDDKSLAALLTTMPDLDYRPSEVYAPRFYQAFIVGTTVLLHRPSPHVYQGYPYVGFFGIRDRITGRWYGIVRNMRDPQMETNKRRAQILHIINRAAKYGWKGPVGSFVDKEKWEDEASKPGVVLEYRIGPNEPPPEEIKPSTVPVAFIELEKMSIADLRDTSGVNVEMLALSNRELAGVTVSQRIRQGLTILQNLFDNARRSTKALGRILLAFIQQYYSDGRIMLINGREGPQMVQMSQQITAGKYDIVVEEAPWSPNKRMETFTLLQQLIPVMMQLGLPVPPTVLDYLDLPADLVQEWKMMIQQALAMQQTMPAATNRPVKGIPSPPKVNTPTTL